MEMDTVWTVFQIKDDHLQKIRLLSTSNFINLFFCPRSYLQLLPHHVAGAKHSFLDSRHMALAHLHRKPAKRAHPNGRKFRLP